MRRLAPSWLRRGWQQTASVRDRNSRAAPRLVIGSDDLDGFVGKTDELGKIGSPPVAAYWSTVTYQPSTAVDETLDPYSDAYTEQQIALYREVSGRSVNQEENELTALDIEAHVAAANPYAHPAPPDVALHMSRIARAIQHSGLASGDHVLDIGCGWGASCELLAFSGLRVTGVDINPAFVELVNRRAARSGLPIYAEQGTFEAIPGSAKFKAVLYYECLHHAVRPWVALRAAFDRLEPGGRVMLVGESLNNDWKTWGLRVDPLSLYCVRKFGWFESGWSVAFIQDCLERCGLAVERCTDEGGTLGWIIIGRKAG